MININTVLTDNSLELIPSSLTLIKHELDHSSMVFEILDVPKPFLWPPELNDDDSFRHFQKTLEADPRASIFGAYYAIDITEGRKLVGTGGFIAPPNEEGMVEIGYSILPEFRRKGLATRLTNLLVERALKDDSVNYVTATTYPHLVGSVGVLKNCGFKGDGDRDDGIIAFRKDR